MSVFSDHECGALSDWEFEQECRRMNRIGSWEREREFDDLEIDLDSEDGEEE